MNILVTGGAGYIGSRVCCELLSSGAKVTVLDNFSNSSEVALERVRVISGRNIEDVAGGVWDESLLCTIFSGLPIDAVIHLAGLKAVEESTKYPLEYYDNNVSGTIALRRVMQELGVRQLIFSSFATVYGNPQFPPRTESV